MLYGFNSEFKMKKVPKVEEIMSKDLFVVSWNDPLKKVIDYMKTENIRHVPVVEDGKFVGLITQNKINEYVRKRIYDPEDEIDEEEFSRVSDFDYLVNRNIPLLFPEDSLLKVLELFIKKKYDCLPVVDSNQNLVGLVSNIDVLLYFYNFLSEKN
ncbi:CBS domain-containing protein [Bacteroidetes/Chlorobi group bacterium MS-B_bin-24]|nr:MAG: CBS domain-containing protein [Bacteroidetes/Chlorobi group bacterium MS-B_bin-24]